LACYLVWSVEQFLGRRRNVFPAKMAQSP